MIQSIPYCENSAELFALVADEPWAVFLDSCQPFTEVARFDIIAFRPKLTLQSFEHDNLITHADGRTETMPGAPLDILNILLQQHSCEANSLPNFLPFRGGAIGYFSYDLCRTLEKIPNIAENDCPIPIMQIGIYQTFIIVDHLTKNAWFISNSIDLFSEIFSSAKIHQKTQAFKLTSAFTSNFSKNNYAMAFEKIKSYIYEGDCYQINLAQRFSASFQGNTYPLYQYLRSINPAPFAAYLNLPQTTVMSFSPEKFIQAESKLISTSPIKGTAPRHADPLIDNANKIQLQHSEKDKAENLMIVDLLRNDFGRVCEYGSIHVNKLFSLESFANVHHLVSQIEGRLLDKYSSIDLLKACFPGGSITGTPKIRAMEIIEELEPHRRNIYCGSIGFINHDGDTHLNIAIRTLYTHENKIYCAAGGAIVYDSQLEAEYQESLDKITILLRAVSDYGPG